MNTFLWPTLCWGVLVLSVVQSAQVGKCPDGVHVDCGEHCYTLVPEPEEWHIAVIACDALEGRLVVIRNQAEQDCINSIRSIHNRKLPGQFRDAHWWIGLRSDHANVADLSGWKWANGTSSQGTAGFKNWASGMPSTTHGNERCASMIFGSMGNVQVSGAWFNAPCSAEKYYVCETDKRLRP